MDMLRDFILSAICLVLGITGTAEVKWDKAAVKLGIKFLEEEEIFTVPLQEVMDLLAIWVFVRIK